MIRAAVFCCLLSLSAADARGGVRVAVGTDYGSDVVFSSEIDWPILFAPNYDDSRTFLALVIGFDTGPSGSPVFTVTAPPDNGDDNVPIVTKTEWVALMDYAWVGLRVAHHSFSLRELSPLFPVGVSASFGVGHSWSDRTVGRNGHSLLFRLSVDVIFFGLAIGWSHWSNAGLKARNDPVDVFYVGFRLGVLD